MGPFGFSRRHNPKNSYLMIDNFLSILTIIICWISIAILRGTIYIDQFWVIVFFTLVCPTLIFIAGIVKDED